MGFKPETEAQPETTFDFDEAIRLLQVGVSDFNFRNNRGDTVRVEQNVINNISVISTVKIVEKS